MKESKYCKVISDDNKVIKYQRKIGVIQEYYRSIPEVNILKLLESYTFNIPKIIDESNDGYFVEEYINGDLFDSIYSDYESINKEDIDKIVQNIADLSLVDYSKVNGFVKWKNVSSFFNFQIQNTKNVWNNYKNKYSQMYEFLNINDKIFDVLEELPFKIVKSRNLCLIHGDRHKNNMIKQNKNIYFIDWELSTVGDLAYDIAFHIHQMKYNREDLDYFIEKLQCKLPLKQKSAIEDVDTYMKFITARSVIYYVKIICENSYSEELLDKFYIRLKKLCEYDEFNIKLKEKRKIKDYLKKYII